ncbi:MAG: hypothetical protein NTW07_03500, partial [candidate division Zixibacteria bacterium]|nr:hypothetical protein [candidate division Zixibacteria bacterium]
VRADKCIYLNRNSAAHHTGDTPVDPDSSAVDTIGVFVRRPIAASNVAELVEYLWYVANFNWVGRRVLNSFSNEDDESIKHVIYCTNLNVWPSGMDEIFLMKEIYTVERKSGLITKSLFRVRTVQGRYNEPPKH